MSRRTTQLLITALLILAGIATQKFAGSPAHISQAISPTPTPFVGDIPPGYVRVARAIDGDTIELEDGTHVRYIGMDTPETVHPDKPVQCFGPEASAHNHELVDGHIVHLVADVEDTDRYGRLLRYVYLSDGTFVNLSLVTGGYAKAYRYPPNIAHAEEIKAAQASAKSAGLGLWTACR